MVSVQATFTTKGSCSAMKCGLCLPAALMYTRPLTFYFNAINEHCLLGIHLASPVSMIRRPAFMKSYSYITLGPDVHCCSVFM